LEDELANDGIEEIPEKGVKFNVKYLGKCPMLTDCGEEETTTAIKEILEKAKEKNKKLGRVCVNITETAVFVSSTSGDNKDLDMEFRIQSISYCMADPTFDHVFAFITETPALELECYAFLCPKKKMAKAATLTIAQGFSLAYQAWQRDNKMKIAEMRRSASAQTPTDEPRSSEIVIQAQVETATNETEKQPKNLIDWSKDEAKPRNDLLEFTEADVFETGKRDWDTFDEIQTENLAHNFERLSMANAPLQILNQLPQDSAFLKFGAFACSPGAEFATSPTDTPRFGSSLTSTVLTSPVGSPFQ